MGRRGTKNKIIIALDGMSRKKAVDIAKDLSGLVWGFKVNDLLFEDPSIIGSLKKFGNVFADVKLYDIPNTVSNSVARLSAAGADMISIHAIGGIEMMKAAKKASGKSEILGITVLTSTRRNSGTKKTILKLAKNAVISDVDGVVCSGQDLVTVSKVKGLAEKLKVVPGIRPIWYRKKDDQKRTVTPRDAIIQGADLIVVGRPIVNAANPVKKIKIINKEIESVWVS